MRAAVLALILVACRSTQTTEPVQPPPDDGRAAALEVAAASFPAAWLVERIGGQHVVVTSVLPPGEDASHWQPPAEVIATVQQADLIVANGAGFEGWMKSATLPEDRVVYSARGLDLITVEAGTHSHGGADEHSHVGTDPHTWGAPALLAAQATAVHAAMVEAAPAHSAAYSDGLRALRLELEALDAALAVALAPAAELAMAANHPAYEYLERAHGLSIQAFDIAPDGAPDSAQVGEVAAWARTTERKIMLWEAAPAGEVRAALPEGIEHVVVDPLELPVGSGSYDYLAQAQGNVSLFLELFEEAGEADAGE